MKKQVLAGVLVTVLLSGLAGPGRAGPVSATSLASGTQAHAAVFDKTRFVLHMGFAYFGVTPFPWLSLPFDTALEIGLGEPVTQAIFIGGGVRGRT